MTNVESASSMVFFHDRPGVLEDPEPPTDSLEGSIDYLMARERAERAAAKAARSMKARHVHQELAQCYARKIRQAGGP
jgi:hypothetical protein